MLYQICQSPEALCWKIYPVLMVLRCVPSAHKSDLFINYSSAGALWDWRCFLFFRWELVSSPTPAVWPTWPSTQPPPFRSWEQRRPCSGTGAPPPCWGKKWLRWWQGWAGAEQGDRRGLKLCLLWSDPSRPMHPHSLSSHSQHRGRKSEKLRLEALQTLLIWQI